MRQLPGKTTAIATGRFDVVVTTGEHTRLWHVDFRDANRGRWKAQTAEDVAETLEQLAQMIRHAGADLERKAAMAEQQQQKPSVGRIVHYQAFGTPGGEFPSVARAAIVAEVHGGDDQEVTVCVLNPSGLFFNRVKYSAEPKPGCWNWPPRV